MLQNSYARGKQPSVGAGKSSNVQVITMLSSHSSLTAEYGHITAIIFEVTL